MDSSSFISHLLEDPTSVLQNIHREWRRNQGMVGKLLCSYVRKLEGDVARAVRLLSSPYFDPRERTIPTVLREQDLTSYLERPRRNTEIGAVPKKQEEAVLHYHIQDPTLGNVVLKILLLRDPVIQEGKEGDLLSFSFDEFVVEGLCALYVPGILAAGGFPELFIRYISPMPGALCSDLEKSPVISGFLMEEVTGGSVARPPDSLLVLQETPRSRRRIVDPTAITSILFQISSCLLYLREKIQFRHRRLYSHNVLLDLTPCSYQAYGFQLQSPLTCKIGDCNHASFLLLTREGSISVSRYKYLERVSLEKEGSQRTISFSTTTRYHLYHENEPESLQVRSLDLYTFLLSTMISPLYYFGVLGTPSLRRWWEGLFLDRRERLQVQKKLKRFDREVTPRNMDSLLTRLHLREDALEYTIRQLGSGESS